MKYFGRKNGTLKVMKDMTNAVNDGWVIDTNMYTLVGIQNPVERIEHEGKTYEVELYNLSAFKIRFPEEVVESDLRPDIFRIIERIFDGYNIYNVVFLDGEKETSYGKNHADAMRNLGLGAGAVRSIDYIEILNK